LIDSHDAAADDPNPDLRGAPPAGHRRQLPKAVLQGKEAGAEVGQ